MLILCKFVDFQLRINYKKQQAGYFDFYECYNIKSNILIGANNEIPDG